ncbi:TaqI-like C-terminal specificity domain-containing protein, partial [Thermodesulfovibrio sp. 1176]|uniref:TaqI-like C-terminal specificity domain-containing protein n=1 Tax=Thermodesulfovibrio sp. 1176 TaxID=3043424 RepID=UPI002482530F
INDNRNLFNYVSDKKVETDMTSLSEESFLFLSQKEYKLKEKIERIGKPLKDWDVNIYYGIKTGLNEAFIINTRQRDLILSNCKDENERKRTEELIKPILRGRDIGRYCYNWARLWMIIIPAGWTNSNKGSMDAEEYFKVTLPALYNYLASFLKTSPKGRKKGLLNRDDQGDYWWELRPCDYYSEFEKEKIVWQEIVTEPQFTYDTNKYFIEATAFVMTGDSIKYICGLLNSKPIAYFFKTFFAGGGLGEEGFRYKKAFLEQLPIPLIKNENKHFISQIESLVDQIHTLKSQDCSSNTSELETKIDKLIYKLYKLTPEEIEIIEQKSG